MVKCPWRAVAIVVPIRFAGFAPLVRVDAGEDEECEVYSPVMKRKISSVSILDPQYG